MLCLTPSYRPWILACAPMARAAGSRDDGGGHPTWFLHAVSGGAVEARVGETAATVVAGGCLLVPPETPFAFSGAATGGIWCHFVVRWDARMAAALARRRGDYRHPAVHAALRQPDATAVWGTPLPPVLAPGEQRRCGAWLDELRHHWRSGQPARVLQAHALLERILVVWAAAAWRTAAPFPDAVEERLARAEDIARQRLADPAFGVAEMAAAVGWGRQHLSAVCRRLRGTTPASFLRRARIAEACDRLRDWPRSAAAIGASVGYPQPAAFVRAFRAETGTTPGRWRAGT